MVLLLLMIVRVYVPIDGGYLSSSSVVLNEFMSHPQNSCTETDGEWIELFNDTNDWINLSGWTVENNHGQKINLSTYLLPPGGYYVLGSCGNESLNGGYSPDYVYGGFTIWDSGSLTLFSKSRVIVDEIVYDSNWSIQAGASCERINPGWISNLASSWDFSNNSFGNGDLGTPGTQNSVFENSFAQNSWAFIKAFVK